MTLHLSNVKYISAYIDQYYTKIIIIYVTQNIHTLHDGRNTIWQLFIFMELEPFIYYFVITQTQNMSDVKYKLAHLNQYPPIIKYQNLYRTKISILYNMEETYCGNSSYLLS